MLTKGVLESDLVAESDCDGASARIVLALSSVETGEHLELVQVPLRAPKNNEPVRRKKIRGESGEAARDRCGRGG